jgi:L-asparaginase
MALASILLISLGGTITMTRSEAGGITPTLTAEDLVKAVPGIEAVASIETVSPLRKPSPSLTLVDLLTLALHLQESFARGIDGAVVIQGTDTIEETAFVLDCLVGGEKPVVVTGAMRGPEAAGADGPANILSASIVAASPSATGRGTLVVLNDEIHAARLVQKAHTALPSAFRSPLGGTVGLVVEGEARFHASTDRAFHLAGPFGDDDAPVALLRIGLGDDGRLLTALPSLGFRGAVIEAMGAGHVPETLVQAIASLSAQMPVVMASRVDTGRVFSRTYGFPGAEIDLLKRGVISAGPLSGLKARLLLMLLLRSGKDSRAIVNAFASFS